LKRLVIFGVILAALGMACAELGARGARAVERFLTVRISGGLEAIGLDWAEVSADGLRVELRGHAPDLFARDLAMETARATAPMAEVADLMTASLAPPERLKPVRVELLRDADGVTLTGSFHGERSRARLIEGLALVDPELVLHDLTGVNAARPASGLGRAVDVAIVAAARVPSAYVRLEPGAVRIEGLARDAEHGAALSSELLAIGGDEVQLTLVLRNPLVVAVPFALLALKEGPSGLRLETCAARSADESAAIEALLNRAVAGGTGSRCPEALGGPPGDWPGAIAAGLEALGGLEAGRFRLEYRMVKLAALAPSGPEDLAGALARLAAALPEGYSAGGVAPEAAAGLSIEEQQGRYWMRATRAAGRVTLAGLVPTGTSGKVIGTYAAAKFGAAALDSALMPGPPAAPEDWERAVLVALDGLAGAAEGTVELAAGKLALEAVTGDPAAAAALHRSLAAAVPEGYETRTRLTVDLPGAVLAVPLNGPRCAAVLAGVQAARPIAFAPGSAVITNESQGSMDAIAATLERCPEAGFEIGGHTDSQGSEGLNMRLSKARAEAVLDALLVRGVRLDRLAAQGYGEGQPLVSNETAEGRARNRRIEFTLVQGSSGGGDAAAAGGQEGTEAK
jgi:OOP family OmpA-OmpF porin